MLYGVLSFSRSDVTFIIDLMNNFVSNCYVPFLKKRLRDALTNVVSEDIIVEIEKILDKNKYPFQEFDTDYKRLSFF